MKLSTVAFLGLGAVGLYELVLKPSFAAASIAPAAGSLPPVGGIQASTTAPAAPTGVPSSAIGSQTTQDKLKAAAAGAGDMLNVDQWCYYFPKVRGVSCPDPGLTIAADQRGKLLTFDEFWAWANSQGLSGFGLAGYYRR